MVLILSPNGEYTKLATLEEARTSAFVANKTVVVTSVLTEAQSNIAAAWPSDRALKVEKGGSIANSTAFTINGPFSAGLYPVFTGTGAVTFGTGSITAVYPQWWGAYTDDTNPTITSASIQKAMNAHPVVDFGGAGLVYRIEKTILLTSPGAEWIGLDVNSGQRLISQGAKIKSTDAGMRVAINIETVSDVEITGLSFELGGVQSTESILLIRLADAATRINIHHNQFSNIYIAIAAQLETATVGAINIHHNIFQNMGNLAIGINSRNAFGVKITDNYFSHCGYAQATDTGHIIISGGVEIRGNQGTIVANNSFIDFTDDNVGADAIRIELVNEATITQGTRNIITGNFIQNINGNGIRDISNTESLIANNQINDVATTTYGTDGYSGNGILLGYYSSTLYVSKTSIAGNLITDCAIGIRAVNGIADSISIIGNIIIGGAIGVSGSFASSTIKSNVIKNTSAELLFLYGSDNIISENEMVNSGAAGAVQIGTTDSTYSRNRVIDDRATKIHDYGIKVGGVTGNMLIENEVTGFNLNSVFLEFSTAWASTKCSQRTLVPVDKTAQCTKGDYSSDGSYLYYAVPTGNYNYEWNWKRVALVDTAW